jgi:hypothetical protein
MAQENQVSYVESAHDIALILKDARLPDPLGPSIWRSLAYFLDRDGDPITPDHRSLRMLLSFVADHKNWRPPGLGMSKEGVVEAVWEVPSVFRWSLEFLPAGEVKWTYIEKKKEGGITHATGKSRPDTVPVPERLQQDTLSA